MKNKTKYILGTLLLALILTGLYYSQAGKVKVDTIKIGAVYPLTGQFSMYGIEFKHGVDLAVGEINENGGVKGRKLQVIFEDDNGDTGKSVTAVRKLINVDKVRYLLTGFSSPSFATAPIAEENKVVYISATVSKIGTGNYVFKDHFDMEEAGRSIGRALLKDGVKKVGIMALNYADTQSYIYGLKSEAKGVEFLEESFNLNDPDFKTQLTKLKAFNPQAIIVEGIPSPEIISLTKQLRDLGLDNKRLYSGVTTYILPFIYNQNRETLIKMRVVDNNYDLDPTNIKAQEFQTKYKKTFGGDLVMADATYTYDDIYALKEALEKSNNIEDTKEVADNLRKVKMIGAAGELSFDSLGNSMRKTYLQTYTKNGWVKY